MRPRTLRERAAHIANAADICTRESVIDAIVALAEQPQPGSALHGLLMEAPLYHAFPQCSDGSGAKDGCPGCRWMAKRDAALPPPAKEKP